MSDDLVNCAHLYRAWKVLSLTSSTRLVEVYLLQDHYKKLRATLKAADAEKMEEIAEALDLLDAVGLL